MKDSDDTCAQLARAITDAELIDWNAEETAHPELTDRLRCLRILEQIGVEHRRSVISRSTATATAPLFEWGHLIVLEKIGEGNFGDVYRAHDSTLNRPVALKLLREDRAGGRLTPERFLAEARRLARVRHPNVLTIHGAQMRDHQAGFWSELLDGVVLEEYLRRNGPLSAAEAAVIGLELCRALAAVHQAGMVHGDVKAANVMREAGGRIVLLDFGAGSELRLGSMGQAGGGTTPADHAGARPDADAVAGLLAELAPVCGTPLILAPELLRGESAGPSADLYALGVLLYRMVSGRYPLIASSLAELIERHARRDHVPLRDLRPELPPAFVQVVETAISPDPATRFASAGKMEMALAAVMGEGGSSTAQRVVASNTLADGAVGDGRTQRDPVGVGAPITAPSRPRWRRVASWSLAGVAIVAIALVAGSLLRRDGLETERVADSAESTVVADRAPAPFTTTSGATSDATSGATSGMAKPAAPARRLEASLTFYRSRGGAREALTAGALLHPGDPLFLEIRGSESMHVYVLNEDHTGSVYVLFPLAGLDQHNPLPPAHWHRLPGRIGGVEQDWQVTEGAGREGFLLIASRHPLEGLERQLEQMVAAAPGRPVEYARIDPTVLSDHRGVGGLTPSAATDDGKPDGLLSTIARELTENTTDPGGLWIRHFVAHNLGS